MFKSLNAYHIMWIIVSFDLPTETKEQRHFATRFRKDIMDDGFTMFQYSVYMRQCPGMDNAKVHLRRIERMVPPYGHVAVLCITDKQFGDMKIFYGAF